MEKVRQYFFIVLMTFGGIMLGFNNIMTSSKHDRVFLSYSKVGQKSWKLPISEIKYHYRRKILSKTYYPIISEGYKINNEDICRGVEKVSCLIIVHTAANHFSRRLQMRMTWLNVTNYSPENIKVVFLLGLVPNTTIQQKIERENKLYGDIVQGYFQDTYRNLTHKGVMGLKWISEHCKNTEIVAKVDDDAIINFFKFFEEMSYRKYKKKTIYCNKIHQHSAPIIRQKTSKWFVNDDVYKKMKYYPHTYCSGFTVFISTDLVPMLYRAAKGSPFFWVDDFFLFGLLPSKVSGINYETIQPNFTLEYDKSYTCYMQKGKGCHYLVFPAGKGITKMWKAVIRDRKQSIYGNYYMALIPT